MEEFLFAVREKRKKKKKKKKKKENPPFPEDYKNYIIEDIEIEIIKRD